MLVTRPESFTYVMRPCTSGAASLALLARSGAPVEVPKPPRKLRKVPQGEVKVLGVSSFEKGEGESKYLADGDPMTYWHSQWRPEIKYPHWVAIDLGKSRELAGFAYLARRQMDNGWIRGYRAYVSDDPEKWGEPVASGEFSSEQGGDEMRIEFSKPAKGRYLKLECLGEWRGRAYCAIAELSALVE